MAKVLVITGSSSPVEKSYSIALTNRFVKEYLSLNPNDEIIILDLNNEPMAQITLNRQNATNFFNQKDSLAYIEQLKNVDKVIISSPMNNFNVSTLVKNYLDHILLADHSFSYKYVKKGEAKGLLDHLKVQILTTQGAPYGWYSWGDVNNYLKGTWQFVGAQVNEPILLAGTKVEPLSKLSPEQAVDQIIDVIKKAVENF